MSLLHKKEGPLKLSKNPKSTFYRIWSVFGGISNLLPISADYSLKSQIGIGKNWVGPPPKELPGVCYKGVTWVVLLHSNAVMIGTNWVL